MSVTDQKKSIEINRKVVRLAETNENSIIWFTFFLVMVDFVLKMNLWIDKFCVWKQPHLKN